MAFSLFDKKDAPTPPSKASAPLLPARPSSGPRPSPPGESAPGIEVAQLAAQLHPVIVEAAICYADGRDDAAVVCLQQGIKAGNLGTSEVQAWVMLLELLRMQKKKAEFEKVSLEFVVRFQRTPPTWVGEEIKAAAQDGQEPVTGGRQVLTGKLSGASNTAIQKIRAEKLKSLKLDLGQLQGADAVGCQLLFETLAEARANRRELAISGADKLEDILKAELTKTAEKSPWLLLLELYQLTGKQAQFDDLGFEYAVKFEVSPPSWVALPKSAVTPAKTQAAEKTAPAGDAGFQLSGIIANCGEQQFANLSAYAASRQDVNVNMAAVSRVDFACAGVLLNTLSALNRVGKQVRINGANTLLLVLFRVMGIDQCATIVRGK